MKNGFVGNAAKNYFDKVYSTVEKGQNGINDGNDFASTVNMKKSDNSSNYMGTLDDYGQQLNASLTSYCVAINDDKYDYAAREISKIEEEVNSRLNYVINSMESLCSTDYILPETTPKIQKIIEDITKSLPESRDISKLHENEMLNFMDRINDIDK